MSEKTVYNYFSTKAHLVFDEDLDTLTGLVDAVAIVLRASRRCAPFAAICLYWPSGVRAAMEAILNLLETGLAGYAIAPP